MGVRAYACRGCAFTLTKRWKGPCPSCTELWSIKPVLLSGEDHPDGLHVELEDGAFASLSDISEDDNEPPRLVIGGKMSSVDDVLCGGIVEGSVVLLTGDPGIGKSTLVLQLLQELSKKYTVIYAIGEETVKRVRFRSRRIGKFSKRLIIGRETELENIFSAADSSGAKLVAIDSLQTLRTFSETTGDELEVGSPTGLKIGMQSISDYAGKTDLTFLLIGHVNKESGIAGPRTLEHACDVALHFESRSPDKDDPIRILHCRHKNRDGEVPKQAYFAMTKNGLVSWNDPEKEEESPFVPDIAPPPPTSPPRRARARLTSIPAPTPEPTPELPETPWTAPDGTTAATVLKVQCEMSDCRGSVDRACTAADGSREKGFHQSRIEKAKTTSSSSLVLVEEPEDPPAPDPFAKPFGAPPKIKEKRKKKPKSELPPSSR